MAAMRTLLTLSHCQAGFFTILMQLKFCAWGKKILADVITPPYPPQGVGGV